MLVLTRKEGESLLIGDNIKLTVLAVKGGQVRVGIQAPQEVNIHREELLADGGAEETLNATSLSTATKKCC